MKPNLSTQRMLPLSLLVRGIKGLVLFLIFSMAVLISISSLQHFFPYTNPSTFLKPKQAFFFIYLPALYTHIFTSGLILGIGLLGFSQWIRTQHLKWHQRLGKVYVGLILALSAPSALIMAIYAQGGLSIKSCFILLSILWWWFTWQAWTTILKKNILAHQSFMLRSYALTLSAVTLRWYSFLLGYFFNWYNLESYLWIAWLSWVPNLIVAELWIRVCYKYSPSSKYSS